MPWSQDEQRALAEIEEHLVQDDPRLAARLDTFNARLDRREGHRRERPKRARRRSRAVIIITISWLLIATLIATLLILALRTPAAGLS